MRWPLLAALGVALPACGCIMVLPGGHAVKERSLRAITIGQTTRAEVETLLGRPLFEWRTRNVLVYEDGPHAVWLLLAAGPPGGVVASAGAVGEKLVIVQYDADNRIRRVGRTDLPGRGEGYRETVEAWLAEAEAQP